jgi:hypothetical protein
MEKHNRIKLLVLEQIMANSESILYHNLNFVERSNKNLQKICESEQFTEEECLRLKTAILMYTYISNEMTVAKASREEVYKAYSETTQLLAPGILKTALFNEVEIESILHIVSNVFCETRSNNPLSIAFNDILIMDFIGKNGKSHMELHYKEYILKNISISIKKYNSFLIDSFSNYKSESDFSRLNIEPKVVALILSLEKDQTRFYRQKEIVLKKELDINDSELKELRKNLKSIKGRDSRGIQTLFRTTSQNHYTLNEMVDKKANIMITVNSIILTVIIGGLFRLQVADAATFSISITILAISSFLSVLFAVLAISPNKTQGRFTKDEINNKQGNLLYFGNFHNMTVKEYEWGMLQKLNDSDYLYSSMIKDIYYLGLTLNRKYKLIRTSLITFIVGLAASFALYFIDAI